MFEGFARGSGTRAGTELEVEVRECHMRLSAAIGLGDRIGSEALRRVVLDCFRGFPDLNNPTVSDE